MVLSFLIFVFCFFSQVLSTTFGLQVTYDGSNDAQIQIHTDWKDMVCGLCGNFDGDESNDFMLSDGTQVIRITKSQTWNESNGEKKS